jgi:single-strand DNA-binding protein
MNNVNLVGRFVRDLELKYSKEGKAMLKSSVAVSRTKEITDFINIVAFGKTAELIAEYHKKGDLIALNGSIWTDSYDKEGQKVYTFEVCVNQITFVKPAKSESSGLNTEENNSDPDSSFPF